MDGLMVVPPPDHPLIFAQALSSGRRCLPAEDARFGPAVQGCRDNFDFTLTFEFYFFSIVPSTLLILAALPRLSYLSRQPPKVKGPFLRAVKLLFLLVFSALQLPLLIYWPTSPLPTWLTAKAASTMALVAGVVAGVLSALEHDRSLRPSSLLNIYLLFSLLFDAVMLRSFWLTPWLDRSVVIVSTVALVVKFVAMCLEAASKRASFIKQSDRRSSPQDVSGIYSQSLYFWLNGLMVTGFRRKLEPRDLYSMDDAITANNLEIRFWSAWNSSTRTKNKLLFAMLDVFKWDALVPVPPRLALIAFTICQPLLVRRLLEYLQDPQQSNDYRIGYGIAGAYFVVYTGLAIADGLYWAWWYRCLTGIRGTLMTAIFRKTTEIPITSSKDKAAVTLMSADVDRIVTGLRDINELWATTVQIAFAVWLLAIELGYACIAPVIVSALSFAAITYFTKPTQRYQKQWLGKIQPRVAITSSVLGSMKNVKLLGLSSIIERMVASLRLEEVNASKAFRLLGAYSSTIALFPLLLSPVASFALYAIKAKNEGVTLDVSRLFTSLSILLILSQPLFALFGSLINSRTAIGCFERIDNYLQTPSRKDYRKEIEDPDPSIVMELDNVSLGWDSTKAPVISGVDLKIKKSNVVLVIGPPGSGKTTLLKACLGETPKTKGTVEITRRLKKIAWCEQSPWLINETIQRNIIGFLPLDKDLYKSVIHACELEEDFDDLTSGDQTSVGSKGATLSGGQKQRIAIARAVYSRPEIIFMDDVLSGLDVVTARSIAARLLSNDGLLRQWGTTAVLATHTVDLLPYADHIVALSDGQIIEQGSFTSLQSAGGYVTSVYKIRSEPSKVDGSDDNKANGRETNADKKKNPELKKGTAISPQGEKSSSELGIYKYYLKSVGFFPMVTFLFLQMLWAFFTSFSVIWLRWWSEANDVRPNQDLGYYIGVYFGLQSAAAVVSAFATWFCFSYMARTSGIWLHDAMLRTVVSAPMGYFDRTDTGSITTRFSQDIQLVDMNLPIQVMVFTQSFFVCLAQVGLIASATQWIVLAFPFLILVFSAAQIYYLRTSKQLRLLDLSEKAPIYTQFLESLEGLGTIRAFSWEHQLREKNKELVDLCQKPFYLLFMSQRWLNLVLNLVSMFLAVLVVLLAVGLQNTISAGAIGVSLTQIISFASYVKQLITTRTTLEVNLGAIARIKEFTEETESEATTSDEKKPPPHWPGKGKVQVSGISARYSSEIDHMAFKDVTFSIEPGQKVGICGRTGSGKSSLVLALFRMIELETGSITIDNIDISTVPRNALRASLNGLGQEPYLLDSTVRQNLDPYEESDDALMVGALEKVQLWNKIDEIGGLGAKLSQDSLSHGQRQLFCLARAMLRRSSVLVLDEVTSNVDAKTDELMQQIIRDDFKDQTIISIAHRLDNIRGYDKVAVMDSGVCVEFDSPDRLMERDSKFKRLYEAMGSEIKET